MGPDELPIGEELTEFPGRSFNLLVRDWYRNRAFLGRSSQGPSGPGQFIPIKAKNVTGTTLQYGHCVAIEGLAFTIADKGNQTARRPISKAQWNSSSLKHHTMGVSLGTCGANKPGTFLLMGAQWLRCNVTDNAHHFCKLAETQADEYAVSTSGGGAPILDRELSATGNQWVFAVLGVGVGGGDLKFFRCRTTTGMTAAVGYGLDDVGTGMIARVNSDGSFEDAEAALSTYADEIEADIPGWGLVDDDGTWFVNAGCNPLVPPDPEES